MPNHESNTQTTPSKHRTTSIPAIAIQPDDADDPPDEDSSNQITQKNEKTTSHTISSTHTASTQLAHTPPPDLVGVANTCLTADQPREAPCLISSPVTSAVSTVPPSPTISERCFQPEIVVSSHENDSIAQSGLLSANVAHAEGQQDRLGRARNASFASTISSVDGATLPDHARPTLVVPENAFTGAGRDKLYKGSSITVASSRRTSMTAPSSITNFERSFSKGTFSPTKSTKADSDTSSENSSEAAPHAVELDLALDADLDTTPFPRTHAPFQLASLVDPKNIEKLTELGGIEGVLRALGTDPEYGLRLETVSSLKDDMNIHDEELIRSNTHETHDVEKGSLREKGKEKGITTIHAANDDDDPDRPLSYFASIEDRQRVYGKNIVPSKKNKSLLRLMWIALQDKVLVLLSVAALISLALGLFQDLGTEPETFSCGPGQICTEPPVEWVEGLAIMSTVIIVVVVGSVNDWQKEKQFKALNEKKEDRTVKVIRDGAEKVVNVKDVVVGDVALVEPGEIVPCDGVFLSGHNVKCDESTATGESDAMKKLPYDECIRKESSGKLGPHTDCFVLSGSKVLEGVGKYVVIAVGTKSFNGRVMMALRGDAENTLLQKRLTYLTQFIAKMGSVAGLVLFSILMIRFFVRLAENNPPMSASDKGLDFVQILIVSVTLIVITIPEGMPLAVTLALAIATKRMTKENLLVRVLGSCETMANASVVCTDKTGTLTQNVMAVVAGSVGVHAKFVRNLEENPARSDVKDRGGEHDHMEKSGETADFVVDQSELNTALGAPLRKLFNEAIALNSTAFEDTDGLTGRLEFVGSKTETALLHFAKELGWTDYQVTRKMAEIVQIIPFASERKAMGVIVRLPNGKWRFYVKGASEVLTRRCSRHVVVGRSDGRTGDTDDDEVETEAIDEMSREAIFSSITFYANQTLRTIALCYRDMDRWPLGNNFGPDEVPYDELACDLTLIGITGIEDPLRPGVREAVADCNKAGVQVKMCTGDNVLTARSIALQCGIFTPGGIIMEGPVFRLLNDQQLLELVPKLQVLARSSPDDKKKLVEKLKALGEIVCVTGDGTNDGPALKTAHVGFSMGIAGTEIAKEASDIILMDDNFASIVKAIMWGRCVNDAVKKYLQFQISVNISAVVTTFISAATSSDDEAALTTVQLLWINIIMDTFAALALATDAATPALLKRKPNPSSAPLFTVDMYKQIVGQAAYQISIIFIFHFLGNRIFGYRPDPFDESVQLHNKAVLKTMIFNSFVFAQIFNSINARRIDRKKNVFKGMLKNKYFLVITGIEVSIQVLIMFVGGQVFHVVRIPGREWGISLALGVMALPIGFLTRCIPNGNIERFLIWTGLQKDPNQLPTRSPESQALDWNPAINGVRDELEAIANTRGNRFKTLLVALKSLTRRSQKSEVKLPSLMTMVPTIVATSVGAGWTPQQGAAERSLSFSVEQLEGKIQFHPNTPEDDPTYVKWGGSGSRKSS